MCIHTDVFDIIVRNNCVPLNFIIFRNFINLIKDGIWIFGWSHPFKLRLIRNTLYTCARLKFTQGRGKTKGMCVERGRREKKSTTLRVPAVARFSFFCFALAMDFLARRYNHLEGYETILVARNQTTYRLSLQFHSANLAFFFYWLEHNPFFMRIRNLKCKSENAKIFRLQFSANYDSYIVTKWILAIECLNIWKEYVFKNY